MQPTNDLCETVLVEERLLQVVDPGQDRPAPAVHRPALSLQGTEDVLRLSDQVAHLAHHQGQGGVGDELELVLSVLGQEVVTVTVRAHNPADISVILCFTTSVSWLTNFCPFGPVRSRIDLRPAQYILLILPINIILKYKSFPIDYDLMSYII